VDWPALSLSTAACLFFRAPHRVVHSSIRPVYATQMSTERTAPMVRLGMHQRHNLALDQEHSHTYLPFYSVFMVQEMGPMKVSILALERL
jgi:hypothetical protein